MVDNSGSSKTQMEAGLAGGLKLEAMMEQLQRQQQARLEMEHKERRLREAHIMYAQQVAAQQAILAAARASGAGFMSSGQLSLVSNQSSVDSEREDEEERGRDSDDDDDEMMEGDEGSEEDDRPQSGLEFLRKQTLALQQGAVHLTGRPIASFPDPGAAGGARRALSPAVRVKQEPEDDLSPAGQPSASSPNGQADWSYDDHFKVGVLAESRLSQSSVEDSSDPEIEALKVGEGHAGSVAPPKGNIPNGITESIPQT